MQTSGENVRKGDEVLLVFVGSPLLDLTAECGPDLLRKYSLVPDDCVQASGKHTDLFRQLFGDPKSRLDAGGSALNSAKIAKWALGKRAKVAFAGCVGDDDYGARLESELRCSGVEPLFVVVAGESTGLCACLLGPGGQRSMCTQRGASALFSEHHLDKGGGINKWLRASQCVFVVGYFVAHSPGVVKSLAYTLLPHQIFTLSLSATYICREFKDILLEVLPKVDILFGNESEIKTFADALGLKEPIYPETAASAIVQMMSKRSGRPGIVVVTRGSAHVILARDKEPVQYFAVPEITVVDGVGCGDALAGAFLAVYMVTGDADRAVKAGIRAAIKIAQVPGCSPPEEKLAY